MGPEQWERVKEVYHAALNRDPRERAAFLADACRGDQEILREVESLLAHGSDDSFLERPAWQESGADGRQADAGRQPDREPGPPHGSESGSGPASLGWAVGERLLHYQIAGKLGEGGMGVVYQARDTHLDRLVAIKVLPPDKVADLGRKARFVREAKAASALNHPNIVTVHDIAEAHGMDFIVMEYVAGKTLDQVIRRKGLPVNEALRIAVPIADALAQAHAAGIIHRDVKPSNVMVTESRQVKLLDFGVAKLMQPEGSPESAAAAPLRTQEGAVVGTAAYMSPEQAEGRPVDARSDIFSFGAVLYEMVSGHRAFPGDSKVSMISAVLDKEPLPLGQEIPNDLARLITRCLRKDPARRYQHMDDVKVALEELKEESDSGTHHVTAGLRPPGRWHWMRVAGIAAAALLLATAAGVTWQFLVRSPKDAHGPILRRLTRDSGLTTDPAMSPDGRLLAYASDRSGEGNLDIWIRQVASGEPIRLTRDKADESEPAFSPDGTRMAFRSEREGGGIYVMPALGGEPRLLFRAGRTPRFSPDGKWIACWTGPKYDTTFPRSYKVFVVSMAGGPTRQVRAEFDLARFPTWSPDGNYILFYGSPAKLGSGKEEFDWWVTPFEGGAAIRTGAFAVLRQQGLSNFQAPGLWNVERNEVLFSASLGDSRHLWRVAISPPAFKITRPVERLTFGEGTEASPSLAAAAPDTGLVFANVASNVDLWSLPMDANQGKATGPPERMTEDAAADVMPDLSPDGRRLAFVSARSGNTEVWVKDPATGREVVLTAAPAPARMPIFSADGLRVAYSAGTNQKADVYAIPSEGGVAEKLCDGCGDTYEWTRDGRWVVVRSGGQPRRVGLVSPVSRQSGDYLQDPAYSFYSPRLSPDNRWLATYGRRGPMEWRLFIVPFRADGPAPAERNWIAVAEGNNLDMTCRWSPDGNILYFTTRRDGPTCIWAQRLHPSTKHPAGEPWPVYHAHSARLSLDVTGATNIAIARSAPAAGIVFPMVSRTGNIWMAQWHKR
jgi:eukaryotic-like serine/threonine-protein kinase